MLLGENTIPESFVFSNVSDPVPVSVTVYMHDLGVLTAGHSGCSFYVIRVNVKQITMKVYFIRDIN